MIACGTERTTQPPVATKVVGLLHGGTIWCRVAMLYKAVSRREQNDSKITHIAGQRTDRDSSQGTLGSGLPTTWLARTCAASKATVTVEFIDFTLRRIPVESIRYC